jgi:ATP-dependent DNA helicase RecG
MKNNSSQNIELIKKAVEVEIKHCYIDITGKKCRFSEFIKDELKSFIKAESDNSKWTYLYDVFDMYAVSDLPSRMKAVKQLVKGIKTINTDDKAKISKTDISIKNPEMVDVMYVKGVGPKVGAILNRLGIFTADDLLHYYPRKHLDYATRTPIKDLKPEQEVTIFGTIRTSRVYASKKRSNLTIVTIEVSDETGIISASWFSGKSNKFMMERYKSQYPQGRNVILSGIVKLDNYSGKLVIDKPQIEILSGDFGESDSLHVGRIVPVYSLTENLNVKTLRRAIHNCIETYSPAIEDFQPLYIREHLSLVDKITAIRQIHFPDSAESLENSRRRLVFDELFLVQLRLAMMRKQYSSNSSGIVLNVKNDGLVDKFVDSLPFELTKAQKSAFNEILNDLGNSDPMQRLLQGDVGSGKTVVACMALLAAVENNYQGAIMAPTEILAEQHYRNFAEWLTPFGLSVGLFVGKHGVKVRRELNQNLKNGQINIAVGTHALIQDQIEFNNLGLVVIDEQHRFGVKQRTELKNKGSNPEMLTMTATPIPRTLALTVHGDLDLTVIDELPPGRKPVKTALVGARDRAKAYSLIRKEIEQGHQAYIVFPLIEESETLSAKAATKEAEKLQKTVFSDLNVGLVHGKLSSAEKDRVMEDFRAAKYNVLVSTTVIEVGVDVPNATVMIIENAERFGLSQLHQLRGRVGRSQEQSYCVLVAETNSPDTRERLSVMTQTNNGFIIAEKDLEIRGPGEFMGTRQSGLPDLVLADIVRDAEILELARETAFDFVKNQDITKYPQLHKKIRQKIEEGLELIGSG